MRVQHAIVWLARAPLLRSHFSVLMHALLPVRLDTLTPVTLLSAHAVRRQYVGAIHQSDSMVSSKIYKLSWMSGFKCPSH